MPESMTSQNLICPHCSQEFFATPPEQTSATPPPIPGEIQTHTALPEKLPFFKFGRKKILEAKLEATAKCDPERAALVPAFVRFEGGQYKISTAPWKGSSDLVGLARANALIMIPRRGGTLEPGDTAQFLPME